MGAARWQRVYINTECALSSTAEPKLSGLGRKVWGQNWGSSGGKGWAVLRRDPKCHNWQDDASQKFQPPMVPLELGLFFWGQSWGQPQGLLDEKGSPPLSYLFYVFEETRGFKKALGCCREKQAQAASRCPRSRSPTPGHSFGFGFSFAPLRGARGTWVAGRNSFACTKPESSGTLCAGLLLADKLWIAGVVKHKQVQSSPGTCKVSPMLATHRKAMFNYTA